MANYKEILPFVRKWEGGLVYFPEEEQYTNRGVQWNTFKALAPKLLNIKNPSVEDLKNMTQAQGDKFIEYFWNKSTNNNKINNQASANAFFEMLWGGGRSGIKWLQRKIGVYPDGVVGNKTVNAANKFDPETLLNEVQKRYNYLASSNPSRYGRFINGWTNRFNDLYNKTKMYFVNDSELLKETPEKKINNKGLITLAAVSAASYIAYKLYTR
jgi:lysozyme family protein